ncbi:MAG TPA: GNAT family N-acetyltransferase [Jiangellaceae bacterium]
MRAFELRGDGVLLAAPTRDNVDIITELCQDEDVQRWTTVPSPYTRDDGEKFLSDVVEPGWESGRDLTWAVRDQEDRSILGMIGMHQRDPGSAEVGFWMGAPSRGRGLMTTAVRLVCEYALDPDGGGMERIVWRAVPGNWGSRRLAWRLGFTFDGTIRRDLLQRGVRRDCWIGTLLAGEPMEPKSRWLDVPTLPGPTVTLRRFTETDADAVVEACTDPVTRHWLGAELPDPYTHESALNFIQRCEHQHAIGSGLFWTGERPDGGPALGSFSLMPIKDGQAEVGYWVHPDARGSGVATEAVRLMKQHAFGAESDGGLGLRRLVLAHAEGNDASRIVAGRAGFTHWGTASKAELLGDGSWVDLHWYELLNPLAD